MGTDGHAGHHGRNHPHGAFEGRATRLYDVLARRFLRGAYRRIAEDIALAAPADGAVLDVGTGPGVLLGEIARIRPDLQVTGIDRSPDMVGAAGRNVGGFGGRVATRVADVADLPFGDGTFDLVVTSLSLHHWDDVDAAAGELARVLRPAGRVFVYDFPSAPFPALDAAARAHGLRPGGPARHTAIRTGQRFFPRCVRHVLSAPGARPQE